MAYSLNKLYQSIGVSKQAFHQRMDRYLQERSIEEQILMLVYRVREDHPTMGLRDMYFKIAPIDMGRDRFEILCKESGLMVERTHNLRKTTDSSGVIRFDNLLIGLVINKPNQVWQSDITYFDLNGKFYYITFIMDAFSRVIVGHAISQRLKTEQTTLPALQKAIKSRMDLNICIHALIFHSDGGGQYYDKDFLKLTEKYKIRNSMCQYPWENGKAERINGIIKNNYLIHRVINSFEQLQIEVDRSVFLYNTQKPHSKLQRKSPKQFENEYFCMANYTEHVNTDSKESNC
ncbi:IS3 family transposase [Microbacter margulisiae]|uniref:Transposase InsO family protein n=1 Tax=Microbacter margulisiae TaxID=1350067 RepID=A0A7W5DQN4_9PORP|nr:IS3 family transposase [Microbacter margulisiae]MBB3186105.1 transposase InsO family protein [Microbacter margulisiae]MBB3186975.1 transposase InsO family protein [Microbacter margulisiae]